MEQDFFLLSVWAPEEKDDYNHCQFNIVDIVGWTSLNNNSLSLAGLIDSDCLSLDITIIV